LVYASIGLGMGTALGRPEAGLYDAAKTLSTDLLNATTDGVTYSEMLTILYDSYLTFLNGIGAGAFATYLEEYFDPSSGLTDESAPALPKNFELFTGTEMSLTFWQVAEQLVERPFNELWIDNGPRRVHIGGKDVTLPEKSCFVFRPTPFNGTVSKSGEGSAWDAIQEIEIPNDYLLRFSLSRSMDEVYTFYSVKEPAFQLSDNARILLGKFALDKDRLRKYLFKPLITELFYTRVESTDGETQEVTSGEAEGVAENSAKTLLNWFKRNDEYLSGVLSMMVPGPDEAENDPKIGDKVRVSGIEGTFYVEGIAHTWSYQGPLKSDLTVTRGDNDGKKIELKDRIFRRNIIQ
jgi:hypothetical protein